MSISHKGDTAPRVLGLTFDQWATLAGQLPGPYAPTFPGAADLRIEWIKSGQMVDFAKRDEEYAHRLFIHALRQEGLTRITSRRNATEQGLR